MNKQELTLSEKIIRQIIMGIIAECTGSGSFLGFGPQKNVAEGARDVLELIAGLDESELEEIRQKHLKK